MRNHLHTVSSLPRGAEFTQCVIGMALDHDPLNAAMFAEQRFGEKSFAARFTRSAVNSGQAGGSTWGATLADDYQLAGREWWGQASAGTIVARLTGIRRVPLRVRLVRLTGGATANWIGESKAKAPSEMTLTADNLGPKKIVATVVVSTELLKFSDPAAERTIGDDLARALREGVDTAFISPSNSGSASTPASITNGVSSVATSGNSSLDLRAVLELFSGDLMSSYWVGHPATIAGMISSETPNLSLRGGEWFGIPVIASTSMPIGNLALVDASGIAYGELGGIEVAVRRQGSIEMASPATDSPSASTVMISLFQNSLVAIQLELTANWLRARTGSVVVLTGLSGT